MSSGKVSTKTRAIACSSRCISSSQPATSSTYIRTTTTTTTCIFATRTCTTTTGWTTTYATHGWFHASWDDSSSHDARHADGSVSAAPNATSASSARAIRSAHLDAPFQRTANATVYGSAAASTYDAAATCGSSPDRCPTTGPRSGVVRGSTSPPSACGTTQILRDGGDLSERDYLYCF